MPSSPSSTFMFGLISFLLHILVICAFNCHCNVHYTATQRQFISIKSSAFDSFRTFNKIPLSSALTHRFKPFSINSLNKSKSLLLSKKTSREDSYENNDTNDTGSFRYEIIDGVKQEITDEETIEYLDSLDLEENAPGELAIMKELLGINIFTYILAGLIAIFLSLNALLGPGWLGQIMGLKGTGTFTDISPSLPDIIDLSNSANLL